MSDVLVVGGGVIGLSLAYELAGQGLSVRLIDASQPGREASWAGAGILPPASPTADDPLEQLTALSNRLHRQWSEALRASTGIDNGYRRCGAFYLARDDEEIARLEALRQWAAARRIEMRAVERTDLAELEPGLDPRGSKVRAYLMPDECQIRNPRHLKALLAACSERQVEIVTGATAEGFNLRGDRVHSVSTSVGPFAADHVVIATGSWTAALAQRIGITTAIRPIRGQMLLLSSPRRILARIVNEGSRYLVPRDDGRVLAGSTEEDVGFDRSTTAAAASDLLAFALSLVPDLASTQLERSWAGLRPSTVDGMPYLGRAPGLENVYLAAGHFRGGLQLSTGTAVVISQLIRGLRSEVDLSAFAVDRQNHSQSSSAGRHPVFAAPEEPPS